MNRFQCRFSEPSLTTLPWGWKQGQPGRLRGSQETAVSRLLSLRLLLLPVSHRETVSWTPLHTLDNQSTAVCRLSSRLRTNAWHSSPAKILRGPGDYTRSRKQLLTLPLPLACVWQGRSVSCMFVGPWPRVFPAHSIPSAFWLRGSRQTLLLQSWVQKSAPGLMQPEGASWPFGHLRMWKLTWMFHFPSFLKTW